MNDAEIKQLISNLKLAISRRPQEFNPGQYIVLKCDYDFLRRSAELAARVLMENKQ